MRFVLIAFFITTTFFSSVTRAQWMEMIAPGGSGCCVANYPVFQAFCEVWNTPQAGADRERRCVEAQGSYGQNIVMMCNWEPNPAKCKKEKAGEIKQQPPFK